MADRIGVLERQARTDEPAAVMTGDGEAPEAVLAHERQHVGRHRALAEVLDRQVGAGAVSAQIRPDDGERAAQPLGHGIPASNHLRAFRPHRAGFRRGRGR